MTDGDISVCVACYPPHIPHLRNLMKSIGAQTMKPKECIIGLSQTNDANKILLEKEFNDMELGFPIIISNSTEVCHEGENRNRAIRLATGKYVTICDADDVIHNKRLELVYYHMERHNCHALLHSFKKRNNNDNNDLNWGLAERPRIFFGDVLYAAMLHTEGRQLHLPDELCIHHAYITFKREVFQHIQQDGTKRFYVGMDSKFVRDILKFYGNNRQTMVFLDLPLVLYEAHH